MFERGDRASAAKTARSSIASHVQILCLIFSIESISLCFFQKSYSSSEANEVKHVNHLSIELRLVLVQDHLLWFEFLVAFDFYDGATRHKQLILIRVGRVLFVVEAKAWIVDLIKDVQNK